MSPNLSGGGETRDSRIAVLITVLFRRERLSKYLNLVDINLSLNPQSFTQIDTYSNHDRSSSFGRFEFNHYIESIYKDQQSFSWNHLNSEVERLKSYADI